MTTITLFSIISVALLITVFLAYRIGYEHGESRAADDWAEDAAIAKELDYKDGYDQGFSDGNYIGFADGRAYAEIAQHNAKIIDSKHGKVYGMQKKEANL